MTMNKDGGRQVCFVDMPFGTKTDPRSGIEIDFDDVYERGIEPAIAAAGLEPIRGDRETTGGIIHTAMFARLLLSEFVLADLTAANPNVFYELGVRHTAKPYTTIPIFATLGEVPFDVGFVRAIPYDLVDGALTDESAAALRENIETRIRSALTGPVSEDSPLFQLFDKYPGVDMSHQVTDVFRDRVEYSEQFRSRLRVARAEGVDGIRSIEDDLGDLATVERGVLMDLYLSYRSAEAWPEMVRLYEALPADLRDSVVARQQLAMALNRRKDPGDEDRAIATLENLAATTGDSAETYGLLGRIYKDRYRSAVERGDRLQAAGFLDQAIGAYTHGFEAEPADYYPGVNAISLLVQKDTDEARAEVDRLVPLVTFAAVRKGGAESSDYWTVATVLELAIVGHDEQLAARVLPRVLTTPADSFMLTTTADNLAMLLERRRDTEATGFLEQAVAALRDAADGTS
jgi:tetratricopeptide (TPR) repeat protein